MRSTNATSVLFRAPRLIQLFFSRELPPRTDGHDWVLKFSTSKDGFALNSLMRKLSKVEGPVILLMSDIPGAVFGAFLSDAPKFSEHFGGTGETFLFTLKPDYQVSQLVLYLPTHPDLISKLTRAKQALCGLYKSRYLKGSTKNC